MLAQEHLILDFFPIINQRKTTTQPIKQEKSLLSFIPSRGAGYPRGKGCLCTGTDLCPSLTEAASTPSYLHLSCGTCTLGQIPSTCACFITEPDQLLHQFLKGPTCSATSSPLGESGGVPSWLPPSKKRKMPFCPPLALKQKWKGLQVHYQQHWGPGGVGIWLCATSHMGQGVTPISFSLEVMRRKREIPPTSQDLGLLCFFLFTPAPDCLRCSCLPA